MGVVGHYRSMFRILSARPLPVNGDQRAPTLEAAIMMWPVHLADTGTGEPRSALPCPAGVVRSSGDTAVVSAPSACRGWTCAATAVSRRVAQVGLAASRYRRCTEPHAIGLQQIEKVVRAQRLQKVPCERPQVPCVVLFAVHVA